MTIKTKTDPVTGETIRVEKRKNKMRLKTLQECYSIIELEDQLERLTKELIHASRQLMAKRTLIEREQAHVARIRAIHDRYAILCDVAGSIGIDLTQYPEIRDRLYLRAIQEVDSEATPCDERDGDTAHPVADHTHVPSPQPTVAAPGDSGLTSLKG